MKPVSSHKFVSTLSALLALFAALGIVFVGWVKSLPQSQPDPQLWSNAFFVVTAQTEPSGLYLVLLFSLLSLWILKKKSSTWVSPLSPNQWIVSLAWGHFLIAALGTWLVAHNYPLASDEYMPDFQAKIFLSGQFQAAIPEKLRLFIHAMTPLQTAVATDERHWNQSYLPVYAALRTPFLALHLQTFVNPLLGAIAVLATAAVVRQIWPGQPWLAVAGAGLIACSPQILITGMTSYAMPAHLAFNTVWLWLYLQPQRKRFWLAPLVGVLAVGLHSPFVHALFVLPFLIRLVRNQQWKAVSIFGIIYLAGCFGWWSWWHLFSPGNAHPDESLLAWNTKNFLLTLPLNLLNIMSWNAFPLSLLALFGARQYSQMPIAVRDATKACLLTFTFYAIIPFDQGLGWGNRYFYGVLGCLILVGIHGLHEWMNQAKDDRAARFVIIGLSLSFFLSLPLRCWQVEKIIRPFATAWAGFRKVDADIIIFDPYDAWSSTDLRRNDPFFLERPLIANLSKITPKQMIILQSHFSKIRILTREDLAAYGLATTGVSPATKVSP